MYNTTTHGPDPAPLKIVTDPQSVEMFVPRQFRQSGLPVAHYIATDDEHSSVMFIPRWEDPALSQAIVDAYNSSLYVDAKSPSMSPLFGREPYIGDEVYIDFGDSVTAHPEVRGVVEDMSDDGIKVDGSWFTWSSMVHVEVLEVK